jgi:hypothetical protein
MVPIQNEWACKTVFVSDYKAEVDFLTEWKCIYEISEFQIQVYVFTFLPFRSLMYEGWVIDICFILSTYFSLICMILYGVNHFSNDCFHCSSNIARNLFCTESLYVYTILKNIENGYYKKSKINLVIKDVFVPHD